MLMQNDQTRWKSEESLSIFIDLGLRTLDLWSYMSMLLGLMAEIIAYKFLTSAKNNDAMGKWHVKQNLLSLP